MRQKSVSRLRANLFALVQACKDGQQGDPEGLGRAQIEEVVAAYNTKICYKI